MDQREFQVDLALIAKLDRNRIRYVSYPTADRFVDSFDSREYAKWAALRDTGMARPLSLCVHLPFCACGCSTGAGDKVVSLDSTKPLRYLSYLDREIALQAPLFRDAARVEQMHWGGGAPTFYPTEDLATLFQSLRTHFDLAPEGEYSIDVDPRTVDAQAIGELGAIGFNRLNLGVRNFAGDTPRTVDGLQRTEQMSALIKSARRSGFGSINVDLVYALPGQTLKGFTETVERVAALRPNRIAIGKHANPSARSEAQKQMRGSGLPSRANELKLLAAAAERLTASGYLYIGMDQFALPNDSLSVAQHEGRLHWNCQGYTTHADCDWIGLGISAIGAIGPTYSQNAGTSSDYCARLDRNSLPILRGIELTRDDLVRRNVMHRLMCHFEISKEAVAVNFLIDFDTYFGCEMETLRAFEQDGLVELDREWICVTPRGRMLVPEICMIFDRYLRAATQKAHSGAT